MSQKKVVSTLPHTVIETLGGGTYGKVESITSKGKLYAKKTYLTPDCPSAIREISFLNSVSHPNIIDIEKIIYNNGRISVVSELCEGTLDDYFQTPRSEVKMIEIFHSILCVLEFMHSRNFVHGDLNVCNVLMKDGVVKVADFGMTRTGDKEALVTTNMCAPEVFMDAIYTTAIDIWGFGTIAFDCLTGSAFARGKDWKETSKSTLKRMGCPVDWKYRQYCTDEEKDLHETCVLVNYCARYKNTNQFNDMLRRCFQFNDVDRPTASELLEYPMFKNLKKPEFKWLDSLPKKITPPQSEGNLMPQNPQFDKMNALFPDEDMQKIIHLSQLVSAVEDRFSLVTHDMILSCYYIVSHLDDDGLVEGEKGCVKSNHYIGNILCEFDFKFLQLD